MKYVHIVPSRDSYHVTKTAQGGWGGGGSPIGSTGTMKLDKNGRHTLHVHP